MPAPSLIRIDPAMPLMPWPDMPAHEVARGSGRQWGAVLHEDPINRLTVGVWAADPVECTWFPQPVDEFMVVVEGEIIIDTAEGETRIKAGESFVLPKGLVCRWRHDKPVRKVFMIVDRAVPGDGKPGDRVIKIDPATELSPSSPPAPALLLSAAPTQATKDLYEAVDGRLTVGVWETTPYHRRQIPFPRDELMYFLEGAVTLTDGNGRAETFKAGECVFVPFGAPCDWRNEARLRKVFSILMPSD